VLCNEWSYIVLCLICPFSNNWCFVNGCTLTPWQCCNITCCPVICHAYWNNYASSPLKAVFVNMFWGRMSGKWLQNADRGSVPIETYWKWHMANPVVMWSETSRDTLRAGGIACAWQKFSTYEHFFIVCCAFLNCCCPYAALITVHIHMSLILLQHWESALVIWVNAVQ